jgi:hypothetical protein
MDPVSTVEQSSSMSWSDVAARMSSEWSTSLRESVQRWRGAIEAAPERFRATLEEYLSNLAVAWTNLVAVHTLLELHPDVPFRQKYADTLEQLRDRYYILSALVMQDAHPKDDPAKAPVAAAPVVIIGIIAFGLVALAAAAAYIQHTRELRDWTVYLREDLQARVEASKDGRQLPPSTAPSSPAERPGDDDKGIPWWGWAVGAGALAAVAWVTVPLFTDRR